MPTELTGVTRRSFVQAGLSATALATSPFVLPTRAPAAEAKPQPRIGLSQYSLRQLFFSKQLDILDYPKFAKDTFGITEIDVWDGGLPGDKKNDPRFLGELKGRAEDVGSDIFLWMAGVVSAQGKTAAERNDEWEKFKQPVDNAAELGCDYVRVFLRAPGREEKDIPGAAKAAAETLRPLADYAAKRKQIIAIEPGASRLSSQGDYLVAVMKELNHDHCKLMPDFGKFRGKVVEYTKLMMPHTAVVSAKSHNFDEQGNERGFDYHALMKVIQAAKFKGIIAIEYEGSHLKPVEGVKATQALIRKAWKA